MNKSMSNSNISVDDFKKMYLEMKQPRSIRRLHKELKIKFPNRKVISLATAFRHSQAEKWMEQGRMVSSAVSEKILNKTIDKQVKEYDQLTQRLEDTSNKALNKVLEAFDKGLGDITKPEQILSLVKASVESIKMKNVLLGQPANLTGHISYDNEDIAKLKSHINELYQSINMDLMKRQSEKGLEEIEIRKKKLN
jgi:hypothetical protein